MDSNEIKSSKRNKNFVVELWNWTDWSSTKIHFHNEIYNSIDQIFFLIFKLFSFGGNLLFLFFWLFQLLFFNVILIFVLNKSILSSNKWLIITFYPELFIYILWKNLDFNEILIKPDNKYSGRWVQKHKLIRKNCFCLSNFRKQTYFLSLVNKLRQIKTER